VRQTFVSGKGGFLMTRIAFGGLVAVILVGGAAVAHAQSRSSRDGILAVQSMRGSRIGVTVQDLEGSDTRDLKSGVVVESVDSAGPADKGGLKAGDAIVEFDGERVRSARQFQRLVDESAAGRAVPVVLSRGGQHVNASVTPEAAAGSDFGMRLLEAPTIVRPAIPPAPAAPRVAPVPPTPPAVDWFGSDGTLTVLTGRSRLGIVTETLNSQLAGYFGVKDGALVKSVADGSAGAKAGIKAGDVITSINGSHVSDASEASRALSELEPAADFTVEVMREHKTITLKGKTDAARRRGVRTF
jgi:serine protease Do